MLVPKYSTNMKHLPVGGTFGQLTLVKELPHDRYHDGKRNQLVRKAEFLCSCGIRVVVNYNNVKRGLTVSCGCFHKSRMAEVKTTHGMCYRPEYRVWEGMRKRCRNQLDPHYGGRGIKVSESWNSFEQFYADMGDRPKGYDIDRIDNDGDYEKGNCRWVPHKMNCRNKSNNRRVCLDGVCRTLAEWAEALGICNATLIERLERHPVREALTKSKGMK